MKTTAPSAATIAIVAAAATCPPIPALGLGLGQSETGVAAEVAAQPYPDPGVVVEAMKRAALAYRRDLSVTGGYAKRWPVDLSSARGDNDSAPTMATTQPPGTPAMGMAFLRAFQVTGDPLFGQAAREAARSLAWYQMATGGWRGDYDLAPANARQFHYRRDLEAGDSRRGKRKAESSLDDGKTDAPLRFLLEFVHTDELAEDPGLRRALEFGLNALLAAQSPNGGWPQRFSGPSDPGTTVEAARVPPDWPREWPDADYSGFYTLNDDNLLRIVRLLLRAHELEGDTRYSEAASAAGEFLLRARLPAPQPAWAQQYNEVMEPVWARRFEPPAASSAETVGALHALVDLWLATGDARFREPLEPALEWLDRVRLPDGRWARFYELGTDRPLYCKRDTYELTYDDSALPGHYSFKVDDIADDIEELSEAAGLTRDELLEERAPPATSRAWRSKAKGQAKKVVEAIRALGDHGFWLRGEMVDAGLFVKHFRSMSLYVEGAEKGGKEFESLRREAGATAD